MCSRAEADSSANESLKLAVAVSFLRSRTLNHLSSSSSSHSDALRWKQKAKERKQEIIRLREDLKEAQNASHCDLFPPTASCKCYFFDNLGDFSPNQIRGTSELSFNDVLRRRFLRLVRTKDSRKTTCSSQRLRTSESKYEDEAEQLRISVDFLVELCEADSNETSNFSNWSHQAVDFILGSLKNVLATGKTTGSVEESISYLITKLITRMCSPSKENGGKQPGISIRLYVQHLIRKLGSEAYIGQRAIFAVCQSIYLLAESLVCIDPFDECFPEMDECMFTLIQLIEFLICDYLAGWAEEETYETGVMEELIRWVANARKAVAGVEDRNGLYVLYMDRVTGELAKSLGHISSAIVDKVFASPQ